MREANMSYLSPEEQAAPRAGCLTYAFFVLATLWVLSIIAAGQVAIWFADQIATYENVPVSAVVWLLAAWTVTVVAALPVGLGAALTSQPRFRSAYRAWLAALGYACWLGLARIFPTIATQQAALAQIGLTWLATGLLVVLARRRGRAIGFSVRAGALVLAIVFAPIMGLPFLAWGALGSRFDAVLALLASLSFGVFAGLLLELWLLRPLAGLPTTSGRELAGHGLAAGIALVIMGGGFGVGGSQLLLMLVLLPLGFIAAPPKR